MRSVSGLFILCCAVLVLAACNKPVSAPNSNSVERGSGSSSVPVSAASFAKFRSELKSKLTGDGKAPQDYADEEPPAKVKEVKFKSGDLEIAAWQSQLPTDGKKHPALVFAHGGFAFSAEDWDCVSKWADSGWVVIVPIFRGENGRPGRFDLFLGEVDDLIAAGEYAKSLECVNENQVFAAGHSVGGTKAILVSMLPSPFRAAGSVGGAADLMDWIKGQEELAPFDLKNADEVKARDPAQWIAAIHIPLVVTHGDSESWCLRKTPHLVNTALKAGKEVHYITPPGDHFTCFPKAMDEIIKRFDRIRSSDR